MRLREQAAVLLLGLMLTACAASGGTKSEVPGEKTSAQRAAEINVELGQGYIRRGDNKIALEKLQYALQLDPQSADAHTLIAILYERIGQPEKAAEHYQASVSLKPESGDMLNNYGAYLCRMHRYPEADEMFKRALKDPFYTTPGALLGNAGVCALESGNSAQAETYFRNALKRDPKQPQSLFQMAQLSLMNGKALDARGFIQRYESVSSASPESLELAARIEDRLGDKETAVKYRSRIREEFPDYKPSEQPGGASSP